MRRRNVGFRVEPQWAIAFWVARWRGRKTAQLIRDQREIEARLRFDGAHALRQSRHALREA